MKKGLCIALMGVMVISGLVLLGQAFLAQPVRAGQQEQQVPKELQVRTKHEVTVAVKLVQVYVTDKGGN
ncbi:MAG: hypothetical protein NUW07_10085, partial [Candidatus Saccharicenans sp.]|nr:hypothetical protein [Candidatus Saccharicenans sp.]